ncbi:MAG: GNAT family N-acetyltransferase [Flavobacteriales bacterium]
MSHNHWEELFKIISDANTYSELLKNSQCLIYETEAKEIVAMAFIVPKGNPNEIYDEKWCHLRFVSVHPKFQGKGLGEEITRKCMAIARVNNEEIMALHTSEIMKGARHIYEKIGFNIVKELPPSLGVRYWLYTYNL